MWLREGAVDMCVHPGGEVTFFIQTIVTLAVGFLCPQDCTVLEGQLCKLLPG